MSLIDDFMDDFYVMNPIKVEDGEGGMKTTWTQGITIQAAIALDTTMQARIADAQGVKNAYNVFTDQSVLFNYHDVIQRINGGEIYRMTSESKEKQTPEGSPLGLAFCTAERWELPT